MKKMNIIKDLTKSILAAFVVFGCMYLFEHVSEILGAILFFLLASFGAFSITILAWDDEEEK